MKELAIKKLQTELTELKKCSKKIEIMKKPVCEALVDFCQQDSEFAQAVTQGGTFGDCMATVEKGSGNALSDLEAYRKAVQFYFPGADIRVQMTVNLCADVEHQEQEPKQEVQKPVVFNLDAFL